MNKATELFSIHMLHAHDIAIDGSELVWEAITFSHDELDDQVVPVNELQSLSDPLTILSAMSEDEIGDEWLFGLAIADQTGKWLYAWTAKNGEIADRDILLRLRSLLSIMPSAPSPLGQMGAVQNRLEHTINNLNTSSENVTAAESRIRDVDMAKEMMNQSKNSILAQAAQAMLAQANQQPQGVLQLLR